MNFAYSLHIYQVQSKFPKQIKANVKKKKVIISNHASCHRDRRELCTNMKIRFLKNYYLFFLFFLVLFFLFFFLIRSKKVSL